MNIPQTIRFQLYRGSPGRRLQSSDKQKGYLMSIKTYNRFRYLSTFALASSLILSTSSFGAWAVENEKVFPDADLQQLVNSRLGLEKDTTVDAPALAEVTSLVGVLGFQVADLTGIEKLQNLEFAWFANEPISDLSKLSGNTKLTNLFLTNTDLTDLTTLGSLPEATRVLAIGQNISLPAVKPGIAFELPQIKNRDGSAVELSIPADSPVKGNIADGKVTWESEGSGTITWQSESGNNVFSGTLTQKVGSATEGEDTTAPQSLKESNLQATSVKLSWKAPSDESGVSAYVITYQNVSTKDSEQVAVNKGRLAHTLDGLTPGTTYRIHVRSRLEAGGTSSESSITITTPAK